PWTHLRQLSEKAAEQRTSLRVQAQRREGRARQGPIVAENVLAQQNQGCLRPAEGVNDSLEFRQFGQLARMGRFLGHGSELVAQTVQRLRKGFDRRYRRGNDRYLVLLAVRRRGRSPPAPAAKD